jgi:hypothetical protein
MGNSAGASAVSYLCASPAVKEESFQQAIIRFFAKLLLKKIIITFNFSIKQF